MFFWSMPKTTCKAISGALDVSVAKLAPSERVLRVTVVAKSSLQGCTELPLFSHSLRGKNFETRWWSSGVRGDVSLQHGAAALQPLLTFWHVEPDTMWLSQTKSHCPVEINNQVFYSHWLGENSNGNAIEGLHFWCLPSGVPVDWCSLFPWAPKGIVSNTLYAVKSTDWMDCLLHGFKGKLLCSSDHAFTSAPPVTQHRIMRDKFPHRSSLSPTIIP